MSFKRSKVSLFIAIMLVVTMALAACGGGSSGGGSSAKKDEVYTVRIGCATVLPSHPNWFMDELKKALEAKSDQFVVEVYPANQLGTNAEMIQGLQSGNVQGVVLPSGLFTSIAPVFVVLSVPGLVMGADTQYKMLNETAVGDAFKAEVAKTGVTPLGFLWCPSQELYLDKEVKDMSGLKGLKIRGSDAKTVQDMLTAFGASPVVMSSGDVMMALQQGTINGLFTDVTFVAPMKVYETAKYCIKDLPGVPNSNTIMISNIFLDSLPSDLRTMFEDTVTEVREKTHDYTLDYDGQCYAQVEEGGGVILTPSDAFMKEVAEKNKTVQGNFKTDYPDYADIYDLVADWVAKNA